MADTLFYTSDTKYTFTNTIVDSGHCEFPKFELPKKEDIHEAVYAEYKELVKENPEKLIGYLRVIAETMRFNGLSKADPESYARAFEGIADGLEEIIEGIHDEG